MIAVDANVILRLIVGDDERQLANAEKLFATKRVYLLPTVILETEWVLRSRYRYGRARVADAILAVMSLPGVTVEHSDAIMWAVGIYRKRGDFADLMHLACVPVGVSAFATFDQGVVADAGSEPPVVIETLG
jgi:predicted nucleic-acid-binding protein